MDEAGAEATKIHALHGWLDREEAHSRHVLGNAKLVSTFSATLAATFLAAAVADEKYPGWDVAAFGFLVGAVALTLALIGMKRDGTVDGRTINHVGTKVDKVHEDAIKAAEKNTIQADRAHCYLVLQVVLSLFSCGVALVPILWNQVFPS
jgi:hypothetical protein